MFQQNMTLIFSSNIFFIIVNTEKIRKDFQYIKKSYTLIVLFKFFLKQEKLMKVKSLDWTPMKDQSLKHQQGH